jgi:hypothetical protein
MMVDALVKVVIARERQRPWQSRDLKWTFCVATRRLNLQSGQRPAAPFFSLLAQRKEGKRKGTLLSPDRCASR